MQPTIEPKRVLITGVTGAIGEPLAHYLTQRGHTVRGFARRPMPALADHVQGDLNDRDKVRQAVDGIDLLSVLEHELGHLAGLEDLDSLDARLMTGTLGEGVRRTPTSEAVEAVFAAEGLSFSL